MTDLDQALRAMLHERASDITTVPADFSDLDSLEILNGGADSAEHHRARWWTFAAAAALVALVVGVTATVRDHDSRDRRPVAPATSHPHPSPTPTAQTLTTCPATPPASWRTALGASSTLGATSATVLAISSTGTMIATRDFGTARDVVVIPPGGTPRKIFTVPEPDLKQVFQGSIDGNWVLLSVARLPRNGNGVMATVMDLILVNAADDSTRTIAQVSSADWVQGKVTINGAVMQHGHIYWDVKQTFASRSGTIEDYDIATGHRRTLYVGVVDAPVATPTGVSWSTASVYTAPLPPVVARVVAHDPQAAKSLATDGSAYAWATATGHVGWWAPGAAQPIERQPLAISGRPQYIKVVVAGPYVYTTEGAVDRNVLRLIDMRSGATVNTTAVLLYGGHGVFGGYPGPIEDGKVLRVDTAKLPGLHC